ncbi:hypothetical protein HYW41_04570 [Candidatus Daviesbacteria bacterium]|nr:hypothetical protein [Candidatus Daviesbacteria bacterium]
MRKWITPLRIIFLIVIGILVLPLPYYIPRKPCFTLTVDCPGGWFFTQPLGFSLGQKFLDVNIKPTPIPSPSSVDQICAQVITPAKNPKTGECKEFGTPCDVPEGWKKVDSCENIKCGGFVGLKCLDGYRCDIKPGCHDCFGKCIKIN